MTEDIVEVSVPHDPAMAPLAPMPMPAPSKSTCFYCAAIGDVFPNGFPACEGKLGERPTYPHEDCDVPRSGHWTVQVPKEPITADGVSSKVLPYVRHQMFFALAKALERPTAYCDLYPFLMWKRADGELEHLHCAAFLAPQLDDDDCPLILRVSINCDDPYQLLPLARQTKLLRPQELFVSEETLARRRASRWHFELSLLPSELLSFVPFLVALIRAHEEGSVDRLIEAPCRLHYWPREALGRDYAWSETAWPMAIRYQRQEQAFREGWPEVKLEQIMASERRRPLGTPRPFLIALHDDKEAWAFGKPT